MKDIKIVKVWGVDLAVDFLIEDGVLQVGSVHCIEPVTNILELLSDKILVEVEDKIREAIEDDRQDMELYLQELAA